VAVTDNLPVGIVVATPNGLTNTCGGTATAVAGSGTVSLTAGTVPTGSNCKVAVNVTGTADGTFTNTTGNVTSTNGGTGNTASANLTVATPPTITKVFGAAMIPLNGTTSLTFTIHNPSATVALTGVAFTDSLPSGLVVATPSALSNTCGGTATAVAGSATVSLTGAPLAALASCTVSVNITGTTAGVKNNSVQVTSTNGGTGNTSNASITVVGPPTISKAFGAASIPLNGSTSLSFTIQNNNTTQSLSGIGFTDTLPAGLVISTPNGLTGSCGAGIIIATQGTSLITLTGATLAQSASCTFSINVTGTAAGQKNNTTSAVTSVEGGTGGTASDSIAVLAPPTISKAFGAPSIPLNTTTSLTFTITNPAANTLALTGVAFSDSLPTPGIVVATPNGLTNTCGGTATAVAGSGTVSLTAGTIAVSSNCTVTINVTGNAAGAYTNTIGPVSSTNGGNGNTASANLTVVAPPSITKAFGAAAITLNAVTSLTFTITNPAANTVPLTGVAFTDTLPAGLTVASPNNLNNTCGGTATATVGSSTISLSGATLAISASCTLSVNITGTVAGVMSNSVTVTSTNGGQGNTSNAALTVQDYQLSITVATAAVIQGGTSAPATLTATPLFGYTGIVKPAATTCTPAGFTCTFTNISLPGTGPNQSGSSAVSVSVAPGTAVGNYTLTLTSTDTSNPAVIHSIQFSLAVECTFSLTSPAFTPLLSGAANPFPYDISVTEVQGGSNCPWTAAAAGDPNVTLMNSSTSGTDTSAGSSVPANFQVTPNAGSSVLAGTITVSYFAAPPATGTSVLNVTQEVPVKESAVAGGTASPFQLVVSSSVSQSGTSLQIANTNQTGSTTVCAVVNASGVADPNNFGITCTAPASTSLPTSGTVPLTVTISSTTPTAALRPGRGQKQLAALYALGLGLPGIVFLGVGASAFGPRRRRLAFRRMTSVLGILFLLALLVLLPSCGGGIKNNPFTGSGNQATYTLTVMGTVINGGTVVGVDIFTVPLTVIPQ
jgi:large repetitive protein